ncbi:MAG: enoyl-CoA hydratase [Gemmatimonadales bacterium]|nr:MAG: enoyl-CoA hydratase [Gemmatimonadales bacterium]
MSADRVAARADGSVLHLTLNRPEKRNAIDRAMVDQLLELLDEADLNAAVKVVVLRGAGSDFCAGADLRELLGSLESSEEEHLKDALKLGQVFVRIRQIPKPFVAAVHGRALAGGCGLALACDIVVARSDATLGYPEIARGFVPAMVMALLRRSVGEKAAFDLAASGRLISAERAREMGLVSRVVPPEQFETEVSRLVESLASSSVTALALTKRLFYAIDMMDFSDAVRLGAKVNALARSTPDFRESVERFLRR